MAKATKTVAVQQEVVRIPDAELVRQLRIDRAAKLWPGVPKVDALLRAYDSQSALYDKVVQDNLNSSNALEEATDKLASYVNDIAALEGHLKVVEARYSKLMETVVERETLLAPAPVVFEYDLNAEKPLETLRIVPAAPIGATSAL